VKSEEIKPGRDTMVVLNVELDNFYAFKNFHMNLTYPKKIVGSCIKEEHLENRPNFRYKKVNIIMGANASGKTTFGRMLMKIFNFIDKKNYELLTDAICDSSKAASFALDMAFRSNILYRISCSVAPCTEEKYSPEHFKVEIRTENIQAKDNYEMCVKRMEEKPYSAEDNYIDELEKIERLDWIFEYPEDTARTLRLPDKDEKFRFVLENLLRALDPSIVAVDTSKEMKNTYVIRLKDQDVVLQSGSRFDTSILSSGTKAGVEVAQIVAALIQGHYSFYYCDEKFSYIHSDIEKAVLSLMIDYIGANAQLFFTSHNTDILDMNLPKHAFAFLRKEMSNVDCPITCIEASSLLKRNTDSLKNAVENDLFSCSPSVDLIFAIADN
jgi:hypothetical protein